jgi:hypothetical protein
MQIQNVIDQVISKTNQTNSTEAQVNPLVSSEEDLLMREIMEGFERVEKERQNEMSSKVVRQRSISNMIMCILKGGRRRIEQS